MFVVFNMCSLFIVILFLFSYFIKINPRRECERKVPSWNIISMSKIDTCTGDNYSQSRLLSSRTDLRSGVGLTVSLGVRV